MCKSRTTRCQSFSGMGYPSLCPQTTPLCLRPRCAASTPMPRAWACKKTSWSKSAAWASNTPSTPLPAHAGLPKLLYGFLARLGIKPRPYKWSAEAGGSIDDLKAVFLDDGIGEDFFRDALELLLSFVAVPAIEIQNEEFSLADVFHGGIAKAGKSVLNSLSLGIEDGALWHDPNVCFHRGIITFGRMTF